MELLYGMWQNVYVLVVSAERIDWGMFKFKEREMRLLFGGWRKGGTGLQLQLPFRLASVKKQNSSPPLESNVSARRKSYEIFIDFCEAKT